MSVHRQVFPRWEVHPGGRPEGRFVLGDAAQAAKALQEQWADRKSGVFGKSVDVGGRRMI